MAIPVQGSPHAEGPQGPDRPHGHGHGHGRRSAPRKRGGLGWIVLWTAAVVAVAAYPVYRFAIQSDEVRAGGDSGDDSCLAAFDGPLVGATLPAAVDCLAPGARWRVTARFDPSSNPNPCRELPADKGYETGMEWRSPQGEVVCLTVTPYTTYEDFDSVGTTQYDFNQADFETLKARLLAAAGRQSDPAGEAG